jgi:TolB-like protein/Tfp pilus assembly protein PilF
MLPVPDRLAASLADRYRLERQPDGTPVLLGRGGTATVYLARDLRHDRLVALKVVHPELTVSVEAERFLREIRLVARLSHPHILPLFDSGEADGLLYYVMPYLRGESLRRRLQREGKLELPVALGIAREVALALDYAHRQGVVHRDIKPENILLEDGQAIVADFGVAAAVQVQAAEEKLTESGRAVGTPAYMSPEQAGGDGPLDGRSDIYSLGCVVYEMLGGEPPFTGVTPQATMIQQVVADPPPLGERRPDVPEPVRRAVERALAKAPGDRFATPAEFTAALEEARSSGGHAAVPVRRRPPRRVVLLAAGGALIAALALVFALAGRGAKRAEPLAIAVLPFQNLGAAEDGYFTDGITEEITSRLAMLPGLGVISRTSADQYRGSGKPLKQIGKELGADYILEGSVRWEKAPGKPSRVRVTPQLIRVSDDRHLWAGRYDEVLEEVFTVQSRIAEQVASALDLALQPPHHAVLAAQPTSNLRAYDFYLRGNEYFSRAGDPGGLRTAEEMYTRATELDPSFALAFARLARSHIWQFHLFSDRTEARLALARRAADSALKLQPDLPEAHLALGQIHYWGELDYEKALAEFRTALAGDPGNGDLAWARGLVERRLGQWIEARADLTRAVDLDPRSLVKSLDLFELHLRRREYAEAKRYVDRALELEPDSPAYIYKALLIVSRDGDLASAAAVLKEGMRRAGTESIAFWVPQFDFGAALWRGMDTAMQGAVSTLALDRFGSDSAGYYLAKARTRRYEGEANSARVYFDSAARVLERRSSARPDDPALHAALALAHAGLGRREEAIREGRRAVELRPPEKDTWYGVDMLRNLAVVYATLGEADSTVKQLRTLLSVPSIISVPLLRADPTWDPVRRDPGFQALLKGRR